MKRETLLDYWIIIYRRKKGIALITVISILTAVVLSLLLKPVYQAKAVFYVPDRSPELSYMSNDSLKEMARGKLLPKAIEAESGPYIGLLKSTRIAEYVHQEFPGKSIEKLLMSDVDFELSNEFMLKVYSRDTDPVIAADIANAYIKYLNLLLQEASLKNPMQDQLLINAQLFEAGKRLDSAKSVLKSYEEKNNIASLDDEIKNLTNQRISFQSQLETTQVQIRENDEKIKSLSEQIKKEGTIVAENEFILTNPSIEYLQKKLSDQSAQIAAASSELKESHPDVRILKNQYKETSERLKNEIKNLVTSQIKPAGTFYEQLRQNLVNLIIDRNKLQANKAGYIQVIERVGDRLRRLPAIKAEWMGFNDAIDRQRKIYEQLKMGLQETEMQQARAIQYVIVVDYAKPPKNPDFPVLSVNILVAVLFGAIAGILYAFFMEYIEKTRKVRTLKLIKTILSEEKG